MENQEREISLNKLFWNIVFGWRCLLICALVLSILAAGLFYLKDMKNYKSLLSIQSSQGEKNYEFTEQELQQLQNARELQSVIDKNEEYMKESELMNINPYEENVLLLRYYVDSDYRFNYTEENSLDYTQSVVDSYQEYTGNGELAQKIIEDLEANIEKKYMEELIRFDSLGNNGVFSIEVIYPKKDKLSEIADILKGEIVKKSEIISEKVGSHTLKLLSENVTVRTDSDLAGVQKEKFDALNLYRTQLSTLNSGLTAEQLQKLQDERAAEKNDDGNSENPVSITKPGLRIKYLILGFVLGIFLAAMWICCKTLFTGRLQDTEEVTERYQIRAFGILQRPEGLSGVDRLLVKIKNRNKKQMTLEQSLDIISSNIELHCKAENISQVYLTGTEIEKIDKNLIEPIIKCLEQAGVKVVYGENICYDAAALRKLVETAYVILIEQAGVSKYQEIGKEIRIITQQNVKILGCIGMEGSIH